MSVKRQLLIVLAISFCAGIGGLQITGALNGSNANAAAAAPVEEAHAGIPEMTPTEVEEESTKNGPASETEPTGPELSPSSIEEAALRDARIIANEPSPDGVTMARGTVGDAQAAIEAGTGDANAPRSAMPWSKFSAYLVVLHGVFTLNVPVPTGRERPRGDVLGLIIDAHTGVIEGRYVGEHTPDVGALGPTIDTK